MFFEDFDFIRFAYSMVALMICFTIHEFAHAYSAYRAGDDTAKLAGRVSLNPIDHLDPMGTVMMVVSSLRGFGIGWGKPVPVNTYRLRRPRWDNLMVSLWGPLSNLITAAIVGTVLRFGDNAMSNGGPVMANVAMLLWYITIISIGLAIFNLLPIPPLDGSHILSALLPLEQAKKFDRFVGQYGIFLLLILVFWPGHILGWILGPPRDLLLWLFTGSH